MQSYQYKSLDTAAGEIRLLSLKPGMFQDPLRISIFHAHLSSFQGAEPALDLPELLESQMPADWRIHRTIDGRYIFESPSGTSWRHPDQYFDYSQLPISTERRNPASQPTQLTFEALSYVWGSQSDPETAYVDCQSKIFAVELGQNLALALRHLRNRNAPRTLWIDAICINQADCKEKGTQVQRMASIYQLANRVVVWLGPESDDSKPAMSMIRSIGAQVELTADGLCLRSPDCEPHARDWFSADAQLGFVMDVWRPIFNLLQREWFQRLWVVQEVQLANSSTNLICGNDELLWTLFCRAITVVGTNRETPENLNTAFVRVMSLLTDNTGCNFDRLLILNSHRKCQDPRDKVYGLLGLAHRDFSMAISPDYSLSLVEVYKSTLLAIINSTHRLDVLTHCNFSRRLSAAPSWLPTWNDRSDVRKQQVSTIAHTNGASGFSSAEFTILPLDVLEVTGVRVAAVKIVSIPLSNRSPDVTKAIQNLERGRRRKTPYINGEDRALVYAALIMGYMIRERAKGCNNSASQLRDMLFKTKRLWFGRRHVFKPSKLDLDLGVAPINGGAFLETDNGYLGVAYPEVRKGDIVCVLLGCNAPLILRPFEASESSERRVYQVISPCVMPGLMDSEALLGPLPKNYRVLVENTSRIDYIPSFTDTLSGITTKEDPRLGKLSEEWEKIELSRPNLNSISPFCWRNKVIQQEQDWDPRLSRKALEHRNVKLETFKLV